MKKLMMLGGGLGFALGLGLSWTQGASGPVMIWRAALAAAVAGWLFRWWGWTLLRSLGSPAGGTGQAGSAAAPQKIAASPDA
jgi:hypothetical protein